MTKFLFSSGRLGSLSLEFHLFSRREAARGHATGAHYRTGSDVSALGWVFVFWWEIWSGGRGGMGRALTFISKGCYW